MNEIKINIRVCESVIMCVVVRSNVVCGAFYVVFIIFVSLAPHLIMTSYLDQRPKHVTNHLNPHLICMSGVASY